MSEKIIVSGFGYEGCDYHDTFEGETLGECVRKLYIDVSTTYDEEEELEEEVNDILENPNDYSPSYYKWAKECKANWDNEDYWLEQINHIDCADFVLLSIYSTHLNKYYYEE